MEIKTSVLQFKETRCLKKGRGIRKEGRKKYFSPSSASPFISALILCSESGRRSSIYILLSVPLGRLDKKGRQPWIFVSFTLSRFEREKENMY